MRLYGVRPCAQARALRSELTYARLIRYGVLFPTNEIGSDPGAIRAWADAAEALEFAYILAPDGVLMSAEAKEPHHEPITTLAFLAAITRRIGLLSGVVVLPMRQTVVFAKQAAEVDGLSEGRLRIGIGLGRDRVAYAAAGQRFSDRGRRLEEQIDVLRRLWTQDRVSFEGRWHRLMNVGIGPPPPQRPIPIWIGGDAPRALERIARLADGWVSHVRPDEAGRAQIAAFGAAVRQAGRDPVGVGISSWIWEGVGGADAWRKRITELNDLGVTEVTFSTIRRQHQNVDGHIRAMRDFIVAMRSGQAI